MSTTYYRILAYNNYGGIVASQTVNEDGIESAHDELMTKPGVREVRTVGPFVTKDGSWIGK